MELIDKSALVAEIENLRKHYIEREDFDIGWNMALDKILSFLDTLEVKEEENTELLKVIDYLVSDKDDYTTIYAEKPHRGKTEWINDIVGKAIAKHFFEVGLKAKEE